MTNYITKVSTQDLSRVTKILSKKIIADYNLIIGGTWLISFIDNFVINIYCDQYNFNKTVAFLMLVCNDWIKSDVVNRVDDKGSIVMSCVYFHENKKKHKGICIYKMNFDKSNIYDKKNLFQLTKLASTSFSRAVYYDGFLYQTLDFYNLHVDKIVYYSVIHKTIRNMCLLYNYTMIKEKID